MHIFYIR